MFDPSLGSLERMQAFRVNHKGHNRHVAKTMDRKRGQQYKRAPQKQLEMPHTKQHGW